jgi:FdhE protein
MATLLARITAGRFAFFAEIVTTSWKTTGQLAVRAALLDIAPLALHLFQRHLYCFMIKKKARDVSLALSANLWQQGYCPFCGSFPHLALLYGRGQRWLQCADCGQTWPYPRLVCPYCTQEYPGHSQVVYVDGEAENFAYTCRRCRRYLLTVSRPSRLSTAYPELAALCLVPFDLILQGKNYLPMAECEWNSPHILGVTEETRCNVPDSTIHTPGPHH